ncbi:MAG: polyketide synthase [Planctomycetota bacterium]
MSEPCITLEIDRDGVALLRMQDPAGKNAFGESFVSELVARLEALSDPAVKCCVVTGSDDVFSAGGDQEVLLDLAEGRRSPYDLTLTRTLLDVPVPTIAAMSGHAVGGGLVFGLCCDMVILAKEKRYGCNFMDLGFTPGMGTTGLLQVACGEYLATEMMMSGRFVRGSELSGGVNAVLPGQDVLPHALGIARRIAEKPGFALRLLKQTLVAPRRVAFERARVSEALMHAVCFEKPETAQRIQGSYFPGMEDRHE